MPGTLYRAHVLCCRGTGCTSGGSESVFEAFGGEIEKRGLADEVKVVMTGCHGLCEMGPIVVLYPDDLLYCRVQAGDVQQIVEETLLKGRPVGRLLYQDPTTAETIPHYHEIPFYDTMPPPPGWLFHGQAHDRRPDVCCDLGNVLDQRLPQDDAAVRFCDADPKRACATVAASPTV